MSSAMMSTAHRWRALPPLLLLAAFAALAISSMARMSITGDEVTHLPAGYSYITTGDFRLNPQHPPLIKALAALPLLALDLRPVDEVRGWKRAREWMFGRNFLTHNAQPLDRIVFYGRLPMVGVGVLLGAGLFAWARRLWGYWPGVFVLFLYTLCPNMLAHAPLVHTDVGVTCFTVLALYALWRYAGSGRLRFAVGCGVALGLALLAKYSGLVTAALVAVLFAATVASRRAVLALCPRDIAAAALAIAVIPTCMIALGFGFPQGLSHYLHGVRLIHADVNPHWEAFLWGEYSKTGFWDYYLLAQLWKTPLPTLLCFAAALLLVGREHRATPLDWGFVLLPIAAFHAAGMWQRASIGVRHVLPAFPLLMLACGATARWVAAHGLRARLGLGALCLWLAAGTLRMWPHFLPYFNELAGGPTGGAFYLDDSNIEWGQAFYAVADYLEAHPGSPARMLAFEPIAPSRYGVRAAPMHLRDVVWPEPGVTYLVGASTLQRSSLFNDHPGVRFDWLRRYRPLERIGWSVYVFRFSTDPADSARADVIYVPRERWYADAVEALARVVARSPDFASAHDTLAAVYADRARWREAHGDADAALHDYFDAAASASRAGPHKAEFRDAVLRLGAQVTIDDAPVDAAFDAAAAACGAGADADCVLALLRCAKKDPRHLRACLNLGSVYANAGFPALAEREWERCLGIDPAFTPARENLARLRGAQPVR
jgi:tetratricopeptide (TPR) repeat protein